MMKLKTVFYLGGVVVFLLASCVSAKKYEQLKDKYDQAQLDRSELRRKLEDCQENQTQLASAKSDWVQQKTAQAQKIESLRQKKKELSGQLERLQKSYNALEKNSSEVLAANSKQNRKLLKKLELKQEQIHQEQERLEQMKADLEQRSRRIEELEGLIAQKRQKMKNLKDEIVTALTDFKGKGVSIERENGKIYVSMKNKLLFSSGSWTVNAEGKRAVQQLAQILEQNPDIDVLIEGHTDNVPYNGHGAIVDNWDLSTKRATSIVRLILENATIDPSRLTAAGRSKYASVASNKTAAGRAKNRRIEIILTPDLKELDKILSGIE